MGFLRYLKFILPIIIILLAGCATSLIKTTAHRDENAYTCFGKNPAREFYDDRDITDSISLKWQNDANGSFTGSSVVIYDSLVFVNDLSGRIYCYNISTGRKIGQLKNDGAVFSSPFIYKFYIVYAAADDKENITHLRYYDYVLGDMKVDTEAEGRCLTQIIGTPEAIIFNTENGNVYKYDMKGNEVWKAETNSITHGSPAMNNDIIIFGNDEGEIIGINNKDGKILYRKKIGQSFFCGTAVSGNIAYAGNDNGCLYAIDLNNGEIKWQFPSGTRIMMTPSVTLKYIYFGNLNGDLFCINKSDGTQLWKTSTGGVLDATPFAAKNLLVVPDLNKKFYFVDRKNGEIIRTYFLEGRNRLSPVIFKNMLFIGFDRGELQAYEFK
jgi:outer membrane protein assembly factor BamB